MEVRPMARPVRFEWTTTIGRGNHTLTKVPKKCAQTRKLLPWVGRRTPNGGILVLQRGEDVNPDLHPWPLPKRGIIIMDDKL